MYTLYVHLGMYKMCTLNEIVDAKSAFIISTATRVFAWSAEILQKYVICFQMEIIKS